MSGEQIKFGIELPKDLHRRLKIAVGTLGIKMKEASAQAFTSWLDAAFTPTEWRLLEDLYDDAENKRRILAAAKLEEQKPTTTLPRVATPVARRARGRS